MSATRIMIVEDEWIIANDLKMNLEKIGYSVCAQTDTGERAIKEAEIQAPDLILMDIMLAGEMNGMEAARIIQERFHIPIIYLTAHADERILQQAKTTAPFGYLLKPFDIRELRTTIEIATYKSRLDRELRLAKEKAEEATALKDKFVSLVAHDLRGPLSTLLGFLKMFHLPFNPDQQEKILSSALQTAERMATLIEELLSVSRLKTGTVRPRPFFVDAFLVAEHAIACQIHPARSKGVTLKNCVPINTRIYADPTLLGEVLTNLVNNAIKFSKAGDVVTLSLAGKDPLSIAVSDTGTGIKPNLLPSLFNYEVKTSTRGTAGETGTGLGLPLSNDIMAAHGGCLRVESTPEKGSSFYADLPAVRPRILVVDDDPPSRKLAERILEPLDADVVNAKDGIEALEALKGSKAHLILSDIYMPNMDGFELLEYLRKDETLKGIPVIVLTVDADIAVREKALKLGAVDFITKPISSVEALPRIGKYISKFGL